ncbi:MAG: ceramidase [Alphaproteobacteria bacterium]|nr:ceramidase [Alphaproteobacteria bacterium]
MAEGFWTGRGIPAAVDWCEPNYAVTPYVAEWWNTLSSLPMVALGLYGLWRWAGLRDRLERRFALCFVFLLFVGAGSAAFHGTLLRLPQALDELPMIYSGLIATWVVLHRGALRDEGRALAWTFVLYAVAFTVAYAVSAAFFAIFLVTYAGLVSYLTIASVLFTWIRPAPRLLVLLLAGAALGFLGTFFGCWLPEHVWLPCDHPAQALQLHSLWHLGAGGGTYTFVLWMMGDRARVQGREARFDRGFVVVE